MLESRTSRGTDSNADQVTGFVKGFAYEAIDGYAVVEGDMVMSEVDKRGLVRPRLSQRGLGQSRIFDRWPNGIVPYELSAELSQRQIPKIDAAVEHWNTNTRMLMVERTEENADDYPDYLEFQGGTGCASFVGRQGVGAQAVWVADICPTGSIIHEIGHAMGLFHEHTRPDRDQYITVNESNIQEGKEINFKVMQAGIQTYGDYDYGSIMHYGEYFFSNNGKPTLEAPVGVRVGQRDVLSAGDIAAVDEMYGTDLSLSVASNEDGRQAEVYISVTNQGSMGAHSLELELELDDGTTWEASGTHNGWECSADDQDLQCSLAVLAADEVSRFTISTAALASSAPSLSARLSSGTFDLNESNNSRDHALPESGQGSNGGTTTMAAGEADNEADNEAEDEADSDADNEPAFSALRPRPVTNAFTPMPDSAEAGQDSGEPTSVMTEGATRSGNSDVSAPDAQAPAGQQVGATASASSSASSSGGGASHPLIALALLGLFGWRRRTGRPGAG